MAKCETKYPVFNRLFIRFREIPGIYKICPLKIGTEFYLIRIWPLLTPRNQYILRAKYILEKSSAEIAHELGIKSDSVRMALTRARKEAYILIKREMEK